MVFSLNRIDIEERNRVGDSKPANLFGGMIHCLLLSSLCLSVFLPARASVIDWKNDYSVFLTQEWDDNFRLNEDQVETASTSLFAVGELRGVTEVSTFRLGLGTTITTYSESSIEDSEFYNLFFKGKRRGERWSGSLDLSFALEPTTQTELLDTGNRIDGEREATEIAPGVSYQVDHRNSIYSSLTLTDVNYDAVPLTEYINNSLAVGWVNQVNETSEISINGSVSEYDPENDDSTTVTGIGIGYGFNMSKATRYDLTLGYAEADTPEGSNQDGNSSVEIQYTLDERNSFSLFVGNGFVESGAGVVRHESRLSLSWNHALAERMQFLVTAEGVSDDNRDYYEIVIGGRHRYSQNLRIQASYRHRNQRTSTIADNIDVNSSSIMFKLLYSPVSGFSRLE